MPSNNDRTTIEKLASMLIDTSLPLKLRFRILFTLKSLASQGHEGKKGQVNDTSAQVVDAISQAFRDTSALLKHECAYCLGQMGDQYAVQKLLNILNDSNEDPMVRHEAGRKDLRSFTQAIRSSLGEALGALGCFDNDQVLDALKTQSVNPRAEVRHRDVQTCLHRFPLGDFDFRLPKRVKSLSIVCPG